MAQPIKLTSEQAVALAVELLDAIEADRPKPDLTDMARRLHEYVHAKHVESARMRAIRREGTLKRRGRKEKPDAAPAGKKQAEFTPCSNAEAIAALRKAFPPEKEDDELVPIILARK